MPLKPLLDYRPALVNGQGIGRYVRELGRSLAARDDVDPALFAPTWAPAVVDTSSLGVESARLLRRRIPSKAVTWAARTAGFGVERFFRGGADLCHHTQYRRLPTRLPEVAMIHDLVFLDTDRFMASETAGRMSTFAREAAQHCAALVTPSIAVADEVAERLGVPRERVFATPLGVDHVAYGAGPERWLPLDPPYFFTAARVEERKNLVAVLWAFERVRERGHERLRWKLAGVTGSGAEAFDEALRKSPAREHVDRLGHVDEKTLRELVTGATAFVLVPFDEGFGLAPLEAMALGVPAVTSAVPVVEEVCGGGAILVDPADIDGLALAMARLVEDSEHRGKCAVRGEEHAQCFTWARTADATLRAYRHALR